jgi:hypothetical protein
MQQQQSAKWRTTMDIEKRTLAEAREATSKQIVILDRGFVYVGDVTIAEGWVHIQNAQNVRCWGTTKGLGELAAKGPLKETVLDPSGTVRAPLHALIGLIACGSPWGI